MLFIILVYVFINLTFLDLLWYFFIGTLSSRKMDEMNTENETKFSHVKIMSRWRFIFKKQC